MMKKILAALLSVTMCLTAILGLFSLTSTGQISEIYLNELSYLSSSKAGWSEIKLNRSVNDGGLRLNNAGAPMSFAKGVAAHADSIVEYDLSSLSAVRFTSYIGVCADGEISMETNVDIEVVPRALTFSVPLGCELSAASAENGSEEDTNTEIEYQEVN